MTLVISTALLGTIAVAAANQPDAAVPKPDPPRGVTVTKTGAWLSSDYLAAERCTDAQKAIGFYRRAYTATRLRMRLDGAVPRVWYACDAARRRAVEWREKAAQAREALGEWVAYHYHWWDWLPANWQQLGACETGYGRRPGNFEHANSRFVSAFGISRSIYDRDAAYHGVPGWNDAQPPTPREQYMAALGHYAMFGDGWTCPGP